MVKDFIALDVETANADFGSICSVGLVHFKDGAVFKSLDILVDSEDAFDPANIRIHGITPEKVAGKPNMARVIPVIAAALENAVIVHHSPFDRTALARAAGRYRTGGLPCTWGIPAKPRNGLGISFEGTAATVLRTLPNRSGSSLRIIRPSMTHEHLEC
ncbi:exonuclease domain-containing protein [Tardiphaga sp. 215_C5_N2_1]|uniref:exonuclease domain-containing protein n=1 Tax=Tardiphaga sp. 215_C5_N2_1 TaxID=3240774 RepID=UPI003F8B0FE5